MAARPAMLMAAAALALSPGSFGAPAGDIGWETNGGALDNDRYAPLTQITPENVKTLGGAWRTWVA